MTAHLLSTLDVADFGAETLRIADLNGDGGPDLLLTQSVYETREITCLAAVTIFGKVLWQYGEPSLERGRIYSDLPVQVYDWDNDGRNEVMFVRQAKYLQPREPKFWAREGALSYEGDAVMVILDAQTGQPKGEFKLPAPADDCFLFADLTGRGRRQDLVVKDRYWNVWGVSAEGKVLWHWNGSPGHFPAIADVDGDGREEVFVGYALIDHDGTVLFSHPWGDNHQDAACVYQMPDGSWRLFFGNGGVHCLTPAGKQLWHHPLAEAQHVVVGRFRDDSPAQVAVINRGQISSPAGGRAPATLHLYDLDGKEIWQQRQPAGSWAAAIVDIDWLGGGRPRCLLSYSRGAGQPAAIYDGDGQVIDTLPMVFTAKRSDEDRASHCYGSRADLWGDSREEVILFGSRGACIYSNARPLAIPTLYNNTLYPGM